MASARTMHQRRNVLFYLAAATLAFSVARPAHAAATTDPRVADLVQAGRLRFALPGNPAFIRRNSATGELEGVGADLGLELAARIGVPLQPVEYPNPPKTLEGLRAGEWDVTILVIDAARQQVMDFTPPVVEWDETYLVRPGSSLRSAADVDQPGIRILVARGFFPDEYLSGTLKHAELVRIDSPPDATILDMLRTGQVDAYATARPDLLPLAAKLPGSRVLDDRFAATELALGIPKGHASWLSYITDVTEQLKASGFVGQSLQRALARGQMTPPRAVAPPAPETEARALFAAFIQAQNAHDLSALGQQLLDSPRFLSITGGTPVWGQDAALKQLAALYQGTWHLEPKLDELQATSSQDDVAQLYVPVIVTSAPAGQGVQTARYMMDQTLVKTEKGWRIASYSLTPAPAP